MSYFSSTLLEEIMKNNKGNRFKTTITQTVKTNEFETLTSDRHQ